MKTKDEILHDLVKADIEKVLRKQQNGNYAAAADKLYQKQLKQPSESRKEKVNQDKRRILALFVAEIVICASAWIGMMYGTQLFAKVAYPVSLVMMTACFWYIWLLSIDNETKTTFNEEEVLAYQAINFTAFTLLRMPLLWQFANQQGGLWKSGGVFNLAVLADILICGFGCIMAVLIVVFLLSVAYHRILQKTSDRF